MEIFLIRHTRTDVAPGTIYGHSEVPLHADFEKEGNTILQKLPAAVDAVYSSPATRCSLLAGYIGATVMFDERLREFNFGRWEGKTWDTIPAGERDAWMNDFVHVATPQGESLLQMNERVQQFWQELLQAPYQTIAVVTHAGVIRLVMAALEGLPLASIFTIPVEYGQIFRVQC